ncbi:hypothetical protein BFZC1_02932 [Lysinibacillus fusiformis ZC1]|nr:hypothetical protein BFZC1_02932 [Lysinibacillus fusiformis ZC1]
MIAVLLVASVVFFKPISLYFRDLLGDTTPVSDDSSKKQMKYKQSKKTVIRKPS